MILKVVLCAGVNAQEPCRQWVSKLVSTQGNVLVQSGGQADWHPVQLDQTFCEGDRIKVARNSRAAFVLRNGALLRVDQNSTMIFTGVEPQETFLIELFRGAAHFFSRKSRSLKVVTPFVNGLVEGTEFLVQVEADRTFVALFEGSLHTENDHGRLLLAKGQAAVAAAGNAPRLEIMVRPRNAAQWTLYFPPVLAEIDGSSLDEAQSATAENAAALIRRAGLRLARGRAMEAHADLDRALSLEPENSRALALAAVMAVARNHREEALRLAHRAVAADPGSAAARVALSYALQADFQLDAALAQCRAAVAAESQNGIAHARLAELLLSLGFSQEALAAANRAVEIRPDLSHAHSMVGFAHLTRGDMELAVQSFSQAIPLDSSAPLPRLGMGLALIHDGKLAQGREQIEIAAGLDTGNSLIRSYLAKAYFDEKRTPLDERQLQVARELDPNDPTPWFYDALRNQSLNRPVEALRDLQKSIALNDNRAVYRSRLQLDEDLAARSASLGRLYNDLGFRQLGLVQGWESLNDDPGNFSAHRLLADSYTGLPRHELARTSELLQSQLLQPISIHGVQPHLAERNLYFLESAGFSDSALNEYGSLYNRNRVALQTSGVVGTQGTVGEEVVLSGVNDGFSMSAGQLYFDTDGFRRNNDQTLRIFELMPQARISPRTSILFGFRLFDEEKGDLSLKFDPTNYAEDLRQNRSSQTMRFGVRHDFTPHSTLLINTAFADVEESLNGFGGTSISGGSLNKMGEARYLYKYGRLNLSPGFGYYLKTSHQTYEDPAWPFAFVSDYTEHQKFGYFYGQIEWPQSMTLTLGASLDSYSAKDEKDNATSPKAGLFWKPFVGTVLRAAYFEIYNRNYYSSQTLEPTQVAGFNQLFDGVAGTRSRVRAIGLDQKIGAAVFAGIEYLERDLSFPYTDITNFPPESKDADWEENLARAYLYWAAAPWMAPSLDVYYEQFDREIGMTIPTELSELETLRLAPALSFFHHSGLRAKITATYIDQSGRLGDPMIGYLDADDQFWVVDLFFGYRLPRRLGLISIQARNLFDEDFQFQDTDPSHSFVPPERQILLNATLFF